MTQHDLARAVDMPQSTIARIERGTVSPRTATLLTLLEATGHRLAIEPIGPPTDEAVIRRRVTMAVPQRTRQALGKRRDARILRRLRRFGVPFVLIGDLAEVAHGSPVPVGSTTEVCVAATDVASTRLELALADQADRTTNDLRVVTETVAGDSYDTLLRNAVKLHVEAGIQVRVAGIEDLIRDRRARRTAADDEAARLLRAVADASQGAG